MEQVRAATGFALEAVEPLRVTVAPTEEELGILREEIDPLRYVIGRG